ncbi:hypothetical protein KAT08_02075 [Candidatus Babeliales bacterium]|nr:hypothetical protein [Candidatus Babeliales bacterium]
MKNVIVRWCYKNERAFEEFAPLKFVGERNQKLGFSNDMHIVLLDGFDRLSEHYKISLKNLGYTLHDASKSYKYFEEKYHQLHRFTDYEKKCFLRWLVIDQIFFGEKIIHYDGDIVFNEDPEIISKKVAGKTFVLQGCPAFTVISDVNWFEQYIKAFDEFANNIEAYSENAWKQRDGWEVTFRTRWSGSRFKKIISSDQDFLSHLMHTGQIKQDSIESIMLSLKDYVVFQNPLFIHFYDDNAPFSYQRENGIDYFLCNRQDGKKCFYKKKVLLWHMQSSFNFYLSKFIMRRKFLPFFIFNRLSTDLEYKSLEKKINVKLRRFVNYSRRSYVYDYFFNKTDFKKIFTNKMWWKQGVFK